MIRLPRGGLAIGCANDLHTEEMAGELQRAYLGTIRRTAKVRASAAPGAVAGASRPGPDRWAAAAAAFESAVLAETAAAFLADVRKERS